mgnify:CR=1 FL=1
MEQKPRWNWVITLAAAFLAFCLGFGVARWTQHTDGVTVRTARTIPAQTESALPSVPAASAPTEKSTAAPTEAATQPPTEPGPLDLNRATAQELTTLPGIGDYTAAAIASINFGEPVAAVDGNLLRVAARVSGCADDIMDARVRKQFTAHLNDAIDLARPGAYNQAMMDLGATVCLPNGAPKCEICPARMMCEAYKNGLTEVLPVRAKKKARKIEERTVLLLFQNGKAALRKRADTGLLASLWEFPSVLGNLDEAGVSLVLAQMGLSAQTVEPAGSAKHIFTHIEWDMKGYFADVTGENDDLFWADAAAFDAAAIPTAFKKFAALVRARLQ